MRKVTDRLVAELTTTLLRCVRAIIQEERSAQGLSITEFCSKGPLPAGESKRSFSEKVRTGKVAGRAEGSGNRRTYYCSRDAWIAARSKPVRAVSAPVMTDEEEAALEMVQRPRRAS